MCGNCNGGCSKGACAMHWIVKILVIVGGVNWGLVGLGMLLDKGNSYNLVTMLLGTIPVAEAAVYLLVGIAAVLMIFGCKCKTCVVTPEVVQSTTNPTV